MDKPTPQATRRRWAILLSAAAATAVASFYPTDKPFVSEPIAAGKRMAKQVAKQTANPASANGEVLSRAAGGLGGSDEPGKSDTLDPFAPRGWKAPPPPAPVQAPIAPVVQAAPPAPVGPPPLPFKFMGSMNEDGAQIIYLSRGEQAFVARTGETLGGDYKVLAMDGQHVEFEYLATGEKQTLTLPASEN